MGFVKSGSLVGISFLLLSIASILWIDRPLALFIHSHGIDDLSAFRYLTERLPLVYEVTAIVLVFLSSFEKKFFTKVIFTLYCVLLVVVTLYIKNQLKICLGREWIKNWSGAQISLINNNIYGFYGKHPNEWKGSYPSGHTTLMSVISFILAIIYPRYRYLWFSAILIMTCSLIILDFHFLGDCLAGIALGGIMAYYFIGLYLIFRRKFQSHY